MGTAPGKIEWSDAAYAGVLDKRRRGVSQAEIARSVGVCDQRISQVLVKAERQERVALVKAARLAKAPLVVGLLRRIAQSTDKF